MEDNRLVRIEDKLDKLAEMLAAQAEINKRAKEDRKRIEVLEKDMGDAKFHIRLVKVLGSIAVALLSFYKEVFP